MAKTGAGFDMDKSKKKFNQRREIVNYLKAHQGKACSRDEIAFWLLQTFPEIYQAKRSRTIAVTPYLLREQVISEVGAFLYTSNVPQIKRTQYKPADFYWQDIADNKNTEMTADITVAVSSTTVKKQSEQDLYPLLSSYLHYELKQYPKRINEKVSSNKRGPNGNRWLHPDMVSMEFLGENWHDEVNACVEVYTRKYTKLWSFEAKLTLHSSNVSESFFQTVSNSSWANFGYLVAAEIKSDVIQELRMLSAAHGIGIIKLDINNVRKSQIVISARERNEIDWSMLNRLVEENDDFLNYVKLVRHFYQTQRGIRLQDWDISEPAIRQVNL